MNTSESIKNLASALLQAQGEFTGVVKDKSNPHFKSKYADLQAAISATEEPLRKHGLLVIQTPRGCVATQSATVVTRLLHSSGEWIQDELELPAGTSSRCDAQTFGSAITYARRYSYLGILGIAPEDDDGNVASGHAGPAKAPAFNPKPQVYSGTTITPIREEAGDAFEADPLFDENGDIIESKATVQHREQKQVRKAPPVKLSNEERRAKGFISEAQERRLIAIAKTNGKEFSDIDQYVASLGLDYAHQIPWKGYDDAISWAGGQNEKRA